MPKQPAESRAAPDECESPLPAAAFEATSDDEAYDEAYLLRCRAAPPSDAAKPPQTALQGWRLLAALSCLGLANAAEAVEVLSAGYLLGGIADRRWQSAISSGVYCGMLAGGIISGVVADRARQRAPALRWALAVATAGGLGASVAPSQVAFFAARVVAGVGVGAATPPLFALAAEVSPACRRGACITYVAGWWMVGSLYAAGLAKVMLPRKMAIDWSVSSPAEAQWRAYSLACAAVAALATLLVLVYVEDAPRADSPSAQPAAPLKALLAPSHCRRLAALAATYWGLNFGYYGLATWITVVLAGAGVRDVYGVALLYSAANLPGSIAALLLIDVVGRRALLAAAMGCASLAAAALGVNHGTVLVVVALAVTFNGAAAAGWAALNAVTVESFSARDRATAIGVLAAVGRCASISAQFVNAALQDHLTTLLAVTAAFMALGTLSTALIVETKRTALDDRD